MWWVLLVVLGGLAVVLAVTVWLVVALERGPQGWAATEARLRRIRDEGFDSPS